MGVIKRFIIIVALIAALPGLLPAPRAARAEPPAPKPLPELDGVAVNPPSQPAAPGALTPRAYLPLVYNNPACQRYGLDCLEPNDSVAGSRSNNVMVTGSPLRKLTPRSPVSAEPM